MELYSEKEMVIKFCEVLQKENKNFSVEVPFFNRSIDVVYYDEKDNFYVLEFKLKDWKKGMIQAKNCSHGAEFVFICLPKEKYSKNIKKELKKNRCGLILFDIKKMEIEKKLVPVKNNVWEKGKSILKSGFEYSIKNENFKLLLSV